MFRSSISEQLLGKKAINTVVLLLFLQNEYYFALLCIVILFQSHTLAFRCAEFRFVEIILEKIASQPRQTPAIYPTPQNLGCTPILRVASAAATTEVIQRLPENNGEMAILSAPWLGLGSKTKSRWGPLVASSYEGSWADATFLLWQCRNAHAQHPRCSGDVNKLPSKHRCDLTIAALRVYQIDLQYRLSIEMFIDNLWQSLVKA